MGKRAPPREPQAAGKTEPNPGAAELRAFLQAGGRIKTNLPSPLSWDTKTFPKEQRAEWEEAKSRMYLICAIDALRKGGVPSPAVAAYLADALEAVLRDPSKAVRAFGIARSRGRTVEVTNDRHMNMARGVLGLRSVGMALKSGHYDGAFEIVARAFHVSEKTVERAWKENRSYVEMEQSFLEWEAAKDNK